MGWLESAHDILNNVEAAGSPLGRDTYTLPLSAYQKKEMQREQVGIMSQHGRCFLQILVEVLVISALMSLLA